MRNGSYIIYVVQHRRVSETPWGKPEGKFAPVPLDKRDQGKWHVCGDDSWGCSMNPHIGSGHSWRAKYKNADKEWWEAFHATGTHGWFNIFHAAKALARVRADDAKGMYDSRELDGHHNQGIRHEFRVVKMELTYKLHDEPVSFDEVAAAVA